jgi:serine/threonine protein phosphatase PrpC
MIETCRHLIGQRRICQDAVGVFELADSTVLVVADGAGGTEDGEIASRSVVESVRQATTQSEGAINWGHVLRQADFAIPSGESTACVVELTATGLRGSSVGDTRIGLVVGDELVFPSEGQQRKPLLGSGVAVPYEFGSHWDGGVVIIGSDGFWDYVRLDRLLAELRFIEFPILAKSLCEMVRLPSGDLSDDVAVVCARRRKVFAPLRRIDILADES